MIKTFEDWIKSIVNAGELCKDYQGLVGDAISNKQLFDIACDANGISYLCDMDSKGYTLPYEVISERFKSFINGRYISEHKNKKGNSYTSKIYCCFNGKIKGDTTLISLLGCKCDVTVGNNHIIQIYADKNTELNVICPKTSKAIVHYWGDKIFNFCDTNVEFIKER